MPWTDEQRSAITLPGNLIVSAAAGAGKTAVLTERIVTRIAAGTSVEHMLVLTFTRAAAAEMKARIMKRLTALSEEAEDAAQAAYLLNEARAVGGAHISTVHAFCARVLRRHYPAIDISPDARIADETEAAVLTEEVKDALLTALCEEENPGWRRLLGAFGGEDAAWTAVSDTVRFLDAQPDGLAWLDDAVSRYTSEAGCDALLGEVVAACRDELRLALDALAYERNQLPLDGMEKVFAILDDTLMRCRALLLTNDYDAYRQGLLAMEYGRLLFPRGTEDAVKNPVRDARDAVKDLLKLQQKQFARPHAEEAEIMRDAGVVLLALSDVVHAYSAAYTQAKRARNVLDFSDLEHLALSALRQPAIAAEYRERFALIAVDEYQDSNRVQEAIVDAIRREDNLFFVGDVKQSIYRFRQAEPALFNEKLLRFSGASGARIDLNKNFRSSPQVLACVNDTFSAIMQEPAAEIAYDERAMLRYGGTAGDGGAELHIVSRETDVLDDALESAADVEVEARLAASRIRRIMDTEQVFDPSTGALRAVTYSDIAILLRSTTHAQQLSETLSQCGIPSYAQLNGGYFDAMEVQIFLNLLRIIDNRRQDVPLISVMLSGIGDFTAEELTQIRIDHRSGTFFEAVAAAAGNSPKVDAFLSMLSRWHAESLLVSVEELIGRLLDETGFFLEMGAGYGGRQRQANLNALLGKAHAFESGASRGLMAFLRHMDLARSNASIGAAQTAGANVVRILTIHKSKGLEFPVVLALQMGARFNLRGDGDTLALHSLRGVALRFLTAGSRVMHDTAVRQSIMRCARREQIAEEMRVLYVAMTRAKTRLVLIGCLRAPAEKLAAAPVRPAPYAALCASCPLDWLMMGRRSSLPATLHERASWLSAAEAPPEVALPPADPAMLSALTTRFSWTYDFASSVTLPAKASVSRVARADASLPLAAGEGETLGKLAARLPDFDEPAFLRKGKPTPAFIGTATHAALQHLPLAHPLTASELPAYMNSLVERQYLTREQAGSIPVDTLLWWIASPLYNRMCRSSRVERELSFTYAVDARKLFQTDANERVLLQGVMDCCFLENGAWVLLDYKTDRVPPGHSPNEIALRHAAQMQLYADALYHITGIPVRARGVVLLTARETVWLPDALS